jgi:hypothetical protein
MANFGSWISGSSAYSQMSRQGSVTSATISKSGNGGYQLVITTDQGTVISNQALSASSSGEAQQEGSVVHNAFNEGITQARSEYAAQIAHRSAHDKSWAERHAERRGRGRSGAYAASADPWGGE